MKTRYEVWALFDYETFDNIDDAINYAKILSMSGELYIDEDIKVVKVEETTIKTFRNGGEVA